jgi:hypothetical protein
METLHDLRHQIRLTGLTQATGKGEGPEAHAVRSAMRCLDIQLAGALRHLVMVETAQAHDETGPVLTDDGVDEEETTPPRAFSAPGASIVAQLPCFSPELE